MKQYLFFATAIATASLFTGCSNNEYVGDQPEALNGTDGVIAFSMGKANTTRAKQQTDGTAAKTLNYVFYVYGEKTVNDVAKTVFDTYKVQYKADPSYKSASNTEGWEYVGNLWDNSGDEKNNVGGGVVNQTIKYWDYSASKYTFYAFSAKPGDVTAAEPKIKVSRTDSPAGYEVTIKSGASIGDLYFADKEEIAKTATGENVNQYKNPVKLTFRNLASKVRVGFYETVPGYKINITKMYSENAAITTETKESTTNFLAECNNTVASQDSKIRVTYNTGEGDTKNRAEVSEKNTSEGRDGNLSEAKILTLGGNLFTKGGAVNYLATTSSSPTWDTGNGDYTFFWPQTTNGDPLRIKVDYTLTATDQTEDSKKETIKVTGATATVPADYVKWAANTAYTYIFKISDKTNGSTGGGAPEGLYPITFDAVVVDYDNKGSITTVSTPSVTASQNGVTFVDPEDPNSGIKFETNKDVFLKVMSGDNEVTDVTINSAYVTSYDYAKSPVQNLGTTGWNNDVNYDGKNKYYKLAKEKQTENGWWILEVKDSGTLTTATTYVIIRVGDAEEGPANS